MATDDDVRRVSVILSVILNLVMEGGIFGFEYAAFQQLVEANPKAGDLHIGYVMINGRRVVVAWVGDKRPDEIETWAEKVIPVESEIEVPIANANPAIN